MGRSGNSLMQTQVGLVARVERERPGAQELAVKVDSNEEMAINYTQLLGRVEMGEQVLLNTTAVRARLSGRPPPGWSGFR